jgi:glycosyltransferase involved in cell wall biosynthesis
MPSTLRVAHVQPLTLDLYGHEDADFGRRARYFLPNIVAAQAALGERPTVHILTSSRVATTMRIDGVEVRFHPCLQPPRLAGSNRRYARQLSLSMLRALSREQADVVHFHGARSLHTMFAAVAWRTRQLDLPLVAQDHGHRPVGPLATAAQRFAIRRAGALLAANADGMQVLRGLGVPVDRIHFVPNGVDRTIFRPGPERAGGQPFEVLVVSRLEKDKDPLTMAAGLAEVVRRGHRIHATVVSRGPLRAAVEDRLRAAAVPCRFIDHVSQPELAEHYRGADVLVLTSLREGFNQSVVEGMGCGLPVVASDIPGVRDGVGEAGILLPPRDPVAVADAVERLITDPACRRRLRALGLERVRQFDWNAIARQLQGIYAQVANVGRVQHARAEATPAA